MQTHQDIWFSVSDEIEHIYFRAHHQPTPVLDFIPWPIRVKGIVFSDESELHSAHGSPAFFAGPGISITQTPGDPDIYTITNTAPGSGPAGANSQVQFNASGAFGASPNFTFVDFGTGQQLLIGRVAGQSRSVALTAANSGDNSLPSVFSPSSSLIISANSFVGIARGGATFNPAWMLDVLGNVNITSPAESNYAYRINGVPFAQIDSNGTQIDLTNISTINGAAPGSQTPWLSDIDGAGHALTDVEYVQVSGDVNITGEYLVNGVPISTGAFDPQAHDVTGIRAANNQYGPFPQARFVSVFFELIGASDNAFLNLILAGQVTAIAVAGAGTGAEPQTGFLFGLVPAGAIYVVDTAMAITTWVEYY